MLPDQSPPSSMDSELARFRIDPQIRDKAAKVCEDHGLELNDVLRALVTKIAREGKVPAGTPDAPRQPAEVPLPFASYHEGLWSPLKPHLDAELAVAVLVRFIADASIRIDEANGSDKPDRHLIETLTQERAKALKLRRSLDVGDAEAIAGVLASYAPAARRSEG